MCLRLFTSFVLRLAIALSLCGLSQNLLAQQKAQRLALVIGNDAYTQVNTLLNAKADATAIARSLEKAGFKVTLKTDVNLDSFKVALRSFKATVSPGDEAVFFFSGHGVEMGGANYLLPIDIKGDAEDQVRDDAVPLQRVLEDLQERKARFSLAIIDACRNNPFRDAGRAIGGRGLAPTTAATGQMVLYSAGSGQQALDRLNDRDPVRNGVFTRVLLKEMETPGLPVGEVLRNVREQVASLAKTVGKEQVPAIYDQSLGRFYFTQPPASATVTQAQSGQGEVFLPTVDLAFWDSIKSSQDRSDFEEYLRQFPEGRFSGLARNRLRQLSATASQASAVTSTNSSASTPARPPAVQQPPTPTPTTVLSTAATASVPAAGSQTRVNPSAKNTIVSFVNLDRLLKAADKNTDKATTLEMYNKAVQRLASDADLDFVFQDAVWTDPRVDITEFVTQVAQGRSVDLQKLRNLSQVKATLCFVNLDSVIRDSGAAARAQKRLEAEFSPRDTEILELAKQLPANSPRLQKLRDELKNDLNARRNEELASFMERANKVVKEVAPKQPCTVVFQEAVWVNASVDITARIVSELP